MRNVVVVGRIDHGNFGLFINGRMIYNIVAILKCFFEGAQLSLQLLNGHESPTEG